MIEIIPNWHPVFVHFTVALFSLATGLLIVARFVPEPLAGQWSVTGRWCLWLGVLFGIVTAAAGLYAAGTVAHDDASHKVMEEHEQLALTTLGTFLVLAAWSAWQVRRGNEAALRHPLFLLLLVAGSGLLLSTAWHGGELVYRHGIGVQSLPAPEGSAGHQHGAGTAAHDDGGHRHDAATPAHEEGGHQHEPGTPAHDDGAPGAAGTAPEPPHPPGEQEAGARTH